MKRPLSAPIGKWAGPFILLGAAAIWYLVRVSLRRRGRTKPPVQELIDSTDEMIGVVPAPQENAAAQTSAEFSYRSGTGRPMGSAPKPPTADVGSEPLMAHGSISVYPAIQAAIESGALLPPPLDQPSRETLTNPSELTPLPSDATRRENSPDFVHTGRRGVRGAVATSRRGIAAHRFATAGAVMIGTAVVTFGALSWSHSSKKPVVPPGAKASPQIALLPVAPSAPPNVGPIRASDNPKPFESPAVATDASSPAPALTAESPASLPTAAPSAPQPQVQGNLPSPSPSASVTQGSKAKHRKYHRRRVRRQQTVG